MKKYFFIFLFFNSFIYLPAYCQHATKSDTLYTIVEREGMSPEIVNGFGAFLSPDEEITSFLLSPSTNSKYRHNYHVMVLRVKSSVKILSITDIFNKYHISSQYRNLTIKIDRRTYTAKSNPHFSNTTIQSVSIKKDNNGNNYIAIVTNHPPPLDAIL